jgi:glycosyltransferase involved in cell wall biosynthesis
VIFSPPRDDVPELLAALDLYVLPSRWEGYPLGLIEAIAAGKPVLATPIPAVAEILGDGGGWLSFPAGDAPALAARLEQLRAEPETMKRMEAEARRALSPRHDAAVMVSRIEEIYAALGRSSSSRPIRQRTRR